MPGKVRHFPQGAQLFLSVPIGPQGTGVLMKTESLNAGRAQGRPPIGFDGDSWAVEGSEGRRYLKWALRKESCQDEKMTGSAN